MRQIEEEDIMKKKIVFLLQLFLVIGLFAEVQSEVNRPMPLNEQNKLSKTTTSMRIIPDAEFVVNPVTVKQDSYHSYLPGGMYGYPIELQNNGLSLYMTYMFRASASSYRSQRIAFVETNGNVGQERQLTTEAMNEGFGSLAIDPVTDNPFFTWHAKYSEMTKLNCYITADKYHLNEGPGFFFPKSIVIDNEPNDDANIYIWPVVFVGPSPNPENRRLHIFASNSGTRPNGYPASNVKYAWADFSNDTFALDSLNLVWHYVSFPYLDAIHNTPKLARAYPTFAVKDNVVAIGGFVSAEEGITDTDVDSTMLYEAHDTFFLVNENYGEGSFETYTFNTSRSIPAPINQDGSVFPENTSDFKIESSYSNHRELSIDNNGNIHFPGNYVCTFSDDTDGRKYWPLTQYVKDVKFNRNTHEISVVDVQPKGDYPNDNLLTIPWDFNEDGNPDTYNEDGEWEYQCAQLPITYHDMSDAFHYNYFRLTHANENGWMAMVWSDTYKAYQYHVNEDPDYATFANAPEVYMAFSADNGNHWSDPVIMNAVPSDNDPANGHYNSAFEGMIPTWFYVAPKVETMDENWGRIHIMFTNADSYNNLIGKGNIMYTSIKVDFGPLTVNNPVAIAKPVILNQNYPNPFNPTTNISFELKQTEKVNLSIYNIKGQLVKTLSNDTYSIGSHIITWNGEDDRNNLVSSGIYFYKLSTPTHDEVKKMILLK